MFQCYVSLSRYREVEILEHLHDLALRPTHVERHLSEAKPDLFEKRMSQKSPVFPTHYRRTTDFFVNHAAFGESQSGRAVQEAGHQVEALFAGFALQLLHLSARGYQMR